jgi:hypothetical protein
MVSKGPPLTLPPLERRFLRLCAASLPILALGFGAVSGWRSAMVALLTGILVAADFFWAASGVRVLLTPGSGVPQGVMSRALGAFAGRTVLLLLGLYAILEVLPGEGPAAAAGITVPLAALAVAGLSTARK